MLLVTITVVYVLIGVVAMIGYRSDDEGFEIALDIFLWPIMLYYWLRYGRGL